MDWLKQSGPLLRNVPLTLLQQSFAIWYSSKSQHGVERTELPLRLKQQTVPNKTHKTTNFKTLDINQWRIVIPERWHTHTHTNGEPDNCCSVLHWENVRPQCREGKLKGKLEISHLMLRRWSWEFRAIKALNLIRQCTREKRTAHRENPRDLQIVLLEYLTEYWSAYMCEQTTLG